MQHGVPVNSALIRSRIAVFLFASIAFLILYSSEGRAQCAPDEDMTQDSRNYYCTKKKWELREDANGVCALQTADSFPKLGQLLSTLRSAKDGCLEAVRLYNNELPQPGRCYEYNAGTRALCKSQNVNLP
jgi:hypothetical protein